MKYTKKFAESIVQRILSGEIRQCQAAQKYNVSASTVSRWLKMKKTGGICTKCGVVAKYTEGEFDAIMNKNKSLKILEIAESIGENRYFVTSNLKRHGYMRQNGEWRKNGTKK